MSITANPTHLVLMVVKSCDALLVGHVPKLDKTVGCNAENLKAVACEVNAEDRIRVSLKGLRNFDVNNLKQQGLCSP